jgi:hypothetical protein
MNTAPDMTRAFGATIDFRIWTGVRRAGRSIHEMACHRDLFRPRAHAPLTHGSHIFPGLGVEKPDPAVGEVAAFGGLPFLSASRTISRGEQDHTLVTPALFKEGGIRYSAKIPFSHLSTFPQEVAKIDHQLKVYHSQATLAGGSALHVEVFFVHAQRALSLPTGPSDPAGH